MPDSVRERIVDAFAARLAAVGGAPSVHRAPDYALADADLPALAYWGGGQRRREDFSGQKEYALEIRVNGIVKGASAAAADTALSALYAETLKAVDADLTLGGLAGHVEEGDLEAEVLTIEGGGAYGLFEIAFAVDFATAEGDPFALAP